MAITEMNYTGGGEVQDPIAYTNQGIVDFDTNSKTFASGVVMVSVVNLTGKGYKSCKFSIGNTVGFIYICDKSGNYQYRCEALQNTGTTLTLTDDIECVMYTNKENSSRQITIELS